MQKYILFSFFILLLVACTTNRATEQYDEYVEECTRLYRFGIWADSLSVSDYRVERGDHLSRIFTGLGFTSAQSYRIVNAAYELFPPRRLTAGRNYHVFRTLDSIPEVTHVVFARGRNDFVVLDLQNDNFRASEYAMEEVIRRRYVEGVIQSNLWNALAGGGGNPLLSLNLSRIFAWQVDFTSLQRGDSFQIIYEVAYINDTIPLGIRSVEGAIFTHENRTFTAIPFEQDSVLIFFDEEGNSLRRAFLRVPLDYTRISSRFSHGRMHPILRTVRPHHGVDFAAPIGTPIRTIGDGVVIERGYQAGGAGNFLRIRHNAAYVTTYMHLRNFAQGTQRGARVTQGQIIGYVGTTGLSTGPHLCFRVHRYGVPINPLTMESPPDLPVHEELLDSFRVVKQNVLAELRDFSVMVRGEECEEEYIEVANRM
jgi:murein DD-endopeptidase MepM/ murein hydrolase activator NlpD